MVVVGILLLGFVSLQKIPLNLLPDITYPKITIRTEYEHAAPREVEERVTKFIESAVGIINNVTKVSSVSRPGWSDVYVEFAWGSDIDVIAMDIREKIQLLENMLPEEVERPVLLRYDPNQDPIMTLAVGGDMDLSDLRRWVEMNIELGLERLDGVAAVKVEGGFENEIVVELDEEKLSQYGLRIATITERLNRENLNVASGSLEEGGNKLTVRTVNRFQTLSDVREVIVADKGGVSGAAGAPSAPVPIPSGGGGLGGLGMGGMGGGGIPGGLGSLMAGLGASMPGTSSAGASGQAEGRSAAIRVKDVAKVHYRHKERTEIARLEGSECIKVSLFKEGDANIVTVAGDVKEAIDRIRLDHRAEPRSPQWEKKLRDPRRKFKKVVNGLSNLLLSYRPFVIEQEPVPLQHDIKIETISDQSTFIRNAIYSVAQTAIWGAMFAVLVLYVFLRNMSSTLIVGLAIPVSIITTFNLMFFKDISFNIMSLGGLALGVGMLVDNSIVVLENIMRRRTFEPDAAESANKGASEVASAITASTLTNIMVFFPILYLEGMFRQIFGDLAWTVAFSLVCSEAVALSIVPMLSVVMGKRVRLPKELLDEMDLQGMADPRAAPGEGGDPPQDDGPGEKWTGSPLKPKNFLAMRERSLAERGLAPGPLFKLGGCAGWLLLLPFMLLAVVLKAMGRASSRSANSLLRYPLMAFDAGFKRMKAGYPELLRKLLARPYLTSLVAITVAAASVMAVYAIGWELLPPVDQAEFRIRIELPTGTPIDVTNERIAAMEEKIRAIQGGDEWIESVFATVGIGTAEGEGSSEKAENIGEIHVSLVDRTRREASDDNIIELAMAALSDEVAVTVRSSKPQLLSYKTPIEIEIESSDLDLLKRTSDLVKKRLTEKVSKEGRLVPLVPGLSEVESSMEKSNPEIRIVIDRDRAAAFGLSVSEITDVIRRKVKGEIPTKFDLQDQQIDLVVQLEKEDRASSDRLRRLTIPGPQGNILLSQVAEIKRGEGPAAITRSENSRVAVIRANIHDRPLGDVVADIKQVLAETKLPPNVFYAITGQNEEMQKSLPSLYLAVALAVVLVYIVLAAQFESLLHPFVIMFCVPFSMVGLTIILLATGQTINIFSMIGILMMIGIAVNDAIVYVTTINLRRDEGLERTEAIVEAGRSRLRPIMITTLTTVLGMVPMAIALGPGSELRAPMAISVIGGLTSSTIFTLLAIPCLYLVLDRILPRSYKMRQPAAEAGGEGDASRQG